MAEVLFPVKKLVRLTEEQERQIADFRFAQRIQSENEAIRRLIELGLEAAKQKERT
jgi:hypothetical protein